MGEGMDTVQTFGWLQPIERLLAHPQLVVPSTDDADVARRDVVEGEQLVGPLGRTVPGRLLSAPIHHHR